MGSTIRIIGCAALIAMTALTSSCGGRASPAGSSTQPADIQWAFTQHGDHPDKLLISTIGQARSRLDVAIYSLTNYAIVDAIVNAEKRGVQVRIITDKSESENKIQRKELDYLAKFRIPIKINRHPGLMHMKVCIVDGRIVTTGSFNYSKAASTENDENLVVLNDPRMAQAFDREFTAMWNDAKRFAIFR